MIQTMSTNREDNRAAALKYGEILDNLELRVWTFNPSWHNAACLTLTD